MPMVANMVILWLVFEHSRRRKTAIENRIKTVVTV